MSFDMPALIKFLVNLYRVIAGVFGIKPITDKIDNPTVNEVISKAGVAFDNWLDGID